MQFIVGSKLTRKEQPFSALPIDSLSKQNLVKYLCDPFATRLLQYGELQLGTTRYFRKIEDAHRKDISEGMARFNIPSRSPGDSKPMGTEASQWASKLFGPERATTLEIGNVDVAREDLNSVILCLTSQTSDWLAKKFGFASKAQAQEAQRGALRHADHLVQRRRLCQFRSGRWAKAKRLNGHVRSVMDRPAYLNARPMLLANPIALIEAITKRLSDQFGDCKPYASSICYTEKMTQQFVDDRDASPTFSKSVDFADEFEWRIAWAFREDAIEERDSPLVVSGRDIAECFKPISRRELRRAADSL